MRCDSSADEGVTKLPNSDGGLEKSDIPSNIGMYQTNNTITMGNGQHNLDKHLRQNRPTRIMEHRPSDNSNTLEVNNIIKGVPWSEVARKRPKRAVIVGNNEACNDSSKPVLKGVPRESALHVYRLVPTTTVDQMVNFLKSDYPEVRCEKLESKNSDIYASFKITVYEENVQSVLNSEKWSKNVCIRRFFHYQKHTPVG